VATLDGYNRVTVDIWGQQVTLKTQNDPEYVQRLARHVDRRMDSIAQKNPRLSTSQVALLAALNIADELFSCDATKRSSLKDREDRL